ncbi:MAG: hypothetical protein WBV11_13765 [Salegentibacter sp.]
MNSKILRPVLVGVLMLAAFTSCEKSETPADTIEGTYNGTITSTNIQFTKAAATEAKAEVRITGDHQIQVHCTAQNLDTIFMLNYYQNMGDYEVCLTGEAFEHMYGHMPGNGMGGMMNSNQSEWMYHLQNEHQPGDEHFGGFHMQDHSFEYLFRMMDGDQPYGLQFRGIKN